MLLSALKEVFDADAILTDPAERWVYGYDNSRRQEMPAAVVFATHSDQVQAAVKLCNQYDVPLTVRGRGTGTCGGAVPLAGSLVLSCERMQNIIQVDPDNRLMMVEPGVLNQTVQAAAAKVGFFWPPDPSSAAFCTVGGNLAYNSAGPRAIKYGTPRENVLGLKAITGAGELIQTGTYTTKGVVGYDLTRLLIGSEGTLAIITEATLKLTPLAEAKQTLRVLYSDIHTATEAVARIMAQPVTPCALEFLDAAAIQLVREQGVPLPAAAKALLIIENDGLSSTLAATTEKLIAAATNKGLIKIDTAANTAEAEQLWAARKALSPALRTIAPNKINEDVVVPVAQLPALITGLEQLSEYYQIKIVNFGHAGNGNIHVNLLTDNLDPTQRAHAERCLSEVFDLVLKLKGTLSGEHGIGSEKRNFVAREIKPESLALMRHIKTVFDPKGILNPMKLFPALSCGKNS